MDLPVQQIWQAALSELQGTLTRTAFENWIRPARLVSVGPSQATLSATNPQVVTTLQNRYADEIGQVLSDLVGRRLDVLVVSDGSLPAPEVPQQEPLPLPRQLTLTSNSGLNPRYVFETYIAGSSNQFAHAASLAVADQPGSKYNPLYIWGGVGLGKTHLLHAIGHKALKNNPDLVLTYVSSETFTNEVIASIRSQRMEEFRERYRSVDLLMIDDIQFIAGKESTQEEFFHTFNALHQSGKQVVISSDKPPKAISNLVERLRSRFEGGLIADVQLPDYEMRTAILSSKAEELGRALPAAVVEYIAQRDQSNIRELEGALNRVLAYAAMTSKPLVLETAIEALSEAGRTIRRESLNPAAIIEVVASHFRISLPDIRGRSRSKEIVVPRQIAMYLIREFTQLSLDEIGTNLGKRDHTTVMHGIEKITRELESDAALRTHVLQLREALLTE